MMSVPCGVARQFVSLLRRCAHARTRDAPPLVLLSQGPEGLSLAAWRGEVGLRWHRPGRLDAEVIALTADHLVAAERGDAEVAFSRAPGKPAVARWSERGIERS